MTSSTPSSSAPSAANSDCRPFNARRGPLHARRPRVHGRRRSCHHPIRPSDASRQPFDGGRRRVHAQHRRVAREHRRAQLDHRRPFFDPGGVKGCSHGWSDAAPPRSGPGPIIAEPVEVVERDAPAPEGQRNVFVTRARADSFAPPGRERPGIRFHGLRSPLRGSLHPWLQPCAPLGRRGRRAEYDGRRECAVRFLRAGLTSLTQRRARADAR